MPEACHLLTVLTIFGCSNMLRWKLSLKNDMNDVTFTRSTDIMTSL